MKSHILRHAQNVAVFARSQIVEETSQETMAVYLLYIVHTVVDLSAIRK